ncbi:hypothetical protein GDI0779 [Gluconacetobacter diazotrophicus PA1 5]|uniref:Uncharacterized protein n=1 Tax=Gluconacetobacter diazotrophicus (strain ATCC 49037 / DSM 5601 / CCUG 37298 / CIP 103539 / LMG 7603 / PAl5) TaxID=272568 RepID=A9HAQ0_GLUDA|nr:hypothetical protein GDI0779 [Gluconacetobacter diazotrophicus PA1 5]
MSVGVMSLSCWGRAGAAPLMNDGGVVRAIQAERRNPHVELLVRLRADHVELPAHEAGGRLQRRAGCVFEGLAGLQHRLFADHAVTMDMFHPAGGVGDFPCAAQQLDRVAAVVLDPDAIGPGEAVFLRLGLVVQPEGPDDHADRAGRRLVARGAVHGLGQGGVRVGVQSGGRRSVLGHGAFLPASA